MLQRPNTESAFNSSTGGRIAHLLAAEGRADLLVKLLESCQPNLDFLELQDFESGYTALHEAIEHGNIRSVVALIKHGASLHTPANDGSTPLDLAYPRRVNMVTDNCNVLTWGVNNNYNLAHVENARIPRKVKELRDVKSVSIGKFHTAFLCGDGSVYTCGFGEGGRLGLGNSQETQITPTKIKRLDNIIQVSCSDDHSLALSSTGKVFSWGVNTNRVLGHDTMNIQPYPVSLKLKTTFTQVLAGRYHSVLVSSAGEIWTCGANNGQLGHPYSPESHHIIPSPVYRLPPNPISIAVSETATVAGYQDGTVMICKDNAVRKVVIKEFHRFSALASVAVTETKKGQLEIIVVLDSLGNLYRLSGKKIISPILWNLPPIQQVVFTGSDSLLLLSRSGRLYSAQLNTTSTPNSVSGLIGGDFIASNGLVHACVYYDRTTNVSEHKCPRPVVSKTLKEDLELLGDEEEVCEFVSRDGDTSSCPWNILVARSEYFRAHYHLNSRWGQSLDRVTVDASTLTVQRLLNWIMRDETPSDLISGDWSEIQELISVADIYLLPGLRSYCELVLFEVLDEENLLPLLTFSNDYQLSNLRSTCIQIILTHLPYYLERGLLLDLDPEILVHMEKRARQEIGWCTHDTNWDSAAETLDELVDMIISPRVVKKGRKKSGGEVRRGMERSVSTSSATITEELDVSLVGSLPEDTSVSEIPVLAESPPVPTAAVGKSKKKKRFVSLDSFEKSPIKTPPAVPQQKAQISPPPPSNPWGVESSSPSLSSIMREEEVAARRREKISSTAREAKRAVEAKVAREKLAEERRVKQSLQWGNKNIGPGAPSLRDIMKEEERAPSSRPKTHHRISPVNTQPIRSGKSEIHDFGAHAAPVQSLASIMAEESNKKGISPGKAFRRPLEIIQIEERAVMELRDLYKVDIVEDQYITVRTVERERVVAPTWAENRMLKF
eukprot:sb/3461739/